MKNLLCALMTFSFLTLAMPAKKAEAGFMILAATQEFVWQHKYETLDTVLVIALPVTMITTGIFAVGIAGTVDAVADFLAVPLLLGRLAFWVAPDAACSACSCWWPVVASAVPVAVVTTAAVDCMLRLSIAGSAAAIIERISAPTTLVATG